MSPSLLAVRQNPLTTEENNIKGTFSSWDSCMAKVYCKWPVIIGIVIVSAILLSVLWCIGRCLCCGAECACCCFRCCAGCCGSGRRRDGYDKQPSPSGPIYPPQRPYSNQYQSSPQPAYNAGSRPQYAQFDSSNGLKHADSLPAMPTWESATSRKVEVWEEPEAHEMNHLDEHGKDTSTQPMLAPSDRQPSPALPSPTHSPYEPFLGSNPAAQAGHPKGGYAAGGYATGGQSTGTIGAQTSSPTGYRGAGAPVQVQPSGYGGANYGSQRQYAQNNDGYSYDHPHTPLSPAYAPAGSTAYDPTRHDYNGGWTQQRTASPYGGGQLDHGDASRREPPGSWL